MSDRQTFDHRQSDRIKIDLETALTLLADEYSVELLEEFTGDTLAAPQLVDRCSASRPTVYRRIRLEDARLVRSGVEPDRAGNHRKIFTNAIEELAVSAAENGMVGEVAGSDRRIAVELAG